jgi:hypothetical protein
MSRLPSHVRSLLALTLLLAICAALPSVGSTLSPYPSGPSYLFLSPNTDDHLSLVEASRRLRSPVQQRYHSLAGDIVRKLGVANAEVHDSVGDWGEGVENSLLVILPVADPETLRCAAAWFGLLAEQKAVLAFHPDPAGTDVLTILDLPGHDLAMARHLLDLHGVRDRTLLTQAWGCRVVIVATGTPAGALREVARDSRGRLRSWAGRGESLAGSTRLQARQRYTEVIHAYQVARKGSR